MSNNIKLENEFIYVDIDISHGGKPVKIFDKKKNINWVWYNSDQQKSTLENEVIKNVSVTPELQYIKAMDYFSNQKIEESVTIFQNITKKINMLNTQRFFMTSFIFCIPIRIRRTLYTIP